MFEQHMRTRNNETTFASFKENNHKWITLQKHFFLTIVNLCYYCEEMAIFLSIPAQPLLGQSEDWNLEVAIAS